MILYGVEGHNEYDQLGDGTTTDKLTPTQEITGATNWIKISTNSQNSESHTFGIKSDATLWSWGKNNGGQLGDGTTTDKLTPIKIGN